jgi:signal transduction histidine kinase/CheY-like chemotaxis protein
VSTILVVDDQASNREYLVSLLGYLGHEVLQAENGAEGIEIARSRRPQLVIADVLMPVMDGYELARRLRGDETIAKTPVVFYTANYLEREAKLLAEQCGVTRIITKPADPETILATITETLQGPAPAAPVVENPNEFTRVHLRLMTDKLSEKVDALEAATERLTALMYLGHVLASERDSVHLIETLCDGARDIVGASYAVIGLFADSGDRLEILRVCGGQSGDPVEITRPSAGIFERLASTHEAICLREIEAHDAEVLPHAHRSLPFVGTRIATASRTYGWMYFSGKPGLTGFTEDDERVVSLMSTTLAIAYENVRRLEELERHGAELERRVAERTAALKRSNEDLARFAYVASHDLQEPLRTVANYTALLGKRYRGQLDATADEFIDFAVDGAKRMQGLIRDLLAYSRVDSGEAAPHDVSLDAALDRALVNLRDAVDDAAATITRGPLPVVRVVESQFVQVLQNLIGNAIKFRGAHAPAIHVDAEPNGHEWIVSVRDDGIGIAPQYHDRIFMLFQRLHTRGEYTGTGLGLAICRRIVERHGGRLWVTSADGKGATFRFSIPTDSFRLRARAS